MKAISRQKKLAFTLVELQFTVAISVMLFLALGSLAIYCGRSLSGLMNYSDLQRESRNALNVMTRDIRQARNVSAFSSQDFTLVDTNNVTIRYQYLSNSETLQRTISGETTVLLEGCDWLAFTMFQRNTTNGTYGQYPAADLPTCKLIQLSWHCYRNILGLKMNTEIVQSAKVVIRAK